jgi:hypothetical protein
LDSIFYAQPNLISFCPINDVATVPYMNQESVIYHLRFQLNDAASGQFGNTMFNAVFNKRLDHEWRYEKFL